MLYICLLLLYFSAGVMDSKLLCPTLSMMLVKTIKALCEINIHYDQKLEITGSLHVRSDGNKVRGVHLLCTILSVLATSYNLKLITGWEEMFYSLAENVVSEHWDRIVDRKNSQRLMTLSWVIG